jgi:anti-anti-sigma factor
MTVPLADLVLSSDGDVVIASVRGEIDISNASELGDAIGRRLTNEDLALIIDLGACEYLDSAGIHLIYELHERLRNRGQDVRVVIAPGAVIAEALRLADVPRTVGAEESVEAALASVRG